MEPLRAILMSCVMQARLSLPCKQHKVSGDTYSDRLIARKKVVSSKNYTNPQKTNAMMPKKLTTKMPGIFRSPFLLVHNNRNHWR
jgi:hypothetical protein